VLVKPNARQIRLKEPVISALSRRQVERLRELAGVSEGFWVFLETLNFTELAADGRLRELANAAYTFKLSEMLSTGDTLVTRSIIRGLRDAFLGVSAWIGFDTQIAEGIGSLFHLTYDEKLEFDVLSAISATSLKDDDLNRVDKDRIHTWIDGLVCLLGVICQLEARDGDLPCVQVPVPVDGYIEACARLYAQDPEGRFWNCMAPKSGSGEEIADALGKAISSGEFGEVGLGAVRVLRAGGVALPWENVVSSLKSPLSGTAPVAEKELAAILATLWNLREFEVGDMVNSGLAELVQQGRLLHHFHLAKQNRWFEGAAWLLFWYLEKEPSAPRPLQVNQAVTGHNAGHGSPIL
jgi:hypothetical protein